MFDLYTFDFENLCILEDIEKLDLFFRQIFRAILWIFWDTPNLEN